MGYNSSYYNFFQILAITYIQFCIAIGFISLDKCSGVRLLVAMVNACPLFKETSKLLARVTSNYQFMFPTEICGGQFLCIFAVFDVTS